jgi:hypothetical protein
LANRVACQPEGVSKHDVVLFFFRGIQGELQAIEVGVPVTLPHQIMAIQFQLFGEVLKGAELPSAGATDLGAELVEWGSGMAAV